MNNKTLASTEIVGAIITNRLTAKQTEALTKDPHSMIGAYVQQDISKLDIAIVENQNNEVNLILPYYSMLDSLDAQAVRDEHIGEVSGGEVLITVGAVVGGWIGSLGVGGSIAGGALIGGTLGGVIAAGIIGGGIAIGITETQKAEEKGEK